MHTQNIETLQKEAVRLLDIEIEILQDILKSKTVLSKHADSEKQTFNKTNTPKELENLMGEKLKVEKLELVIAVVGTMKAGKSTTINAIVGAEVLPNRNRPMTALPTLITHTKGQTEPVLEFKHKEPIESLMQELLRELDALKNKKLVDKLIDEQPEMKSTIEHIRNHQHCETEYHGQTEIAQFLAILNDLVRLSSELRIDFPFHEYDEMHEIPVIKVEFAFLRDDTSNTHGKLSLLDTPGPNESGQAHLKKMLSEQLKKSSAVLAVLDYTQLKSDADAQVRDDLMKIAEVSAGRMFALVNKFDQKNSNSDTAEQTKTYVSKNLLDGKISEDHVFPVSAQSGFLANRALSELQLNGVLPNSKDHEWVVDFMKHAFGTRWDKTQSIDDISESAQDLWENSKFTEPLNSVLVTAKNKAAPWAIDSVASKLQEVAKNINNFLAIRQDALSNSVKKLQDGIQAIQGDINRIVACEKTATQSANKSLNAFNGEMEAVFKQTKSKLSGEIDKFFKSGKANIEKDISAEIEKIEGNLSQKVPLTTQKGTRGAKAKLKELKDELKLFGSEDAVIKFSSAEKDKAVKLVKYISDAVEVRVQIFDGTIKAELSKNLDRFNREFLSSTQDSVKKIIDEFKARMEEDGLELDLRIPDIKDLQLGIGGADILDKAIESKTETVTRRRRKTGFWGGLCEIFNTDDWGWESYGSKEEFYVVDVQKLKNQCDKNIEKMFDSLNKRVSEKIDTPLKKNISAYFVRVKEIVENIREDMLEGMRQKEKSGEELVELKAELANLAKKSEGVREDCSGLFKDVKNILKVDTV